MYLTVSQHNGLFSGYIKNIVRCVRHTVISREGSCLTCHKQGTSIFTLLIQRLPVTESQRRRYCSTLYSYKIIESGCFTFAVHMESNGHLLKDDSIHLKFTMSNKLKLLNTTLSLVPLFSDVSEQLLGSKFILVSTE